MSVSVEAWQVHGKSTTNSSTCRKRLDEVDDTPPSYSRGLLFSTKQQTRVHGTFDIFPPLLGLALLQTTHTARANHVVHGTGTGSRVLKGWTLKDGSHSHQSFNPFIVIVWGRRVDVSFTVHGLSKILGTVIHPHQFHFAVKHLIQCGWLGPPCQSIRSSTLAPLPGFLSP